MYVSTMPVTMRALRIRARERALAYAYHEKTALEETSEQTIFRMFGREEKQRRKVCSLGD